MMVERYGRTQLPPALAISSRSHFGLDLDEVKSKLCLDLDGKVRRLIAAWLT
jgi:hypothetical protein